MIRVTYTNVKDVRPGDTVFYTGGHSVAIEKDGLIMVNEQPIIQLLDNFSHVYYVK